MEYKITLFAEDIDIFEKFQIVKINGETNYVDSEGLISKSIGELIEKKQENWKKKIREAIIKKLPPNPAISDFVNRHMLEFDVYSQMCTKLEKIYLEGLTLTFKIEISEISPEVPEIQEKIYNKEINLKKLSTGYIKINDILIINNIELISFLYNFLNKDYKEIVSVTETITEIRFHCNKWIQLGSVSLKDINNINIKKLIKQIMFDDVISEETFVI